MLGANGFHLTLHRTFHEFDPNVGGTYKMAFRNFTSGNCHTFGGTHLELVPNERVYYTARFDDPNLPGEMKTTVLIRPYLSALRSRSFKTAYLT